MAKSFLALLALPNVLSCPSYKTVLPVYVEYACLAAPEGAPSLCMTNGTDAFTLAKTNRCCRDTWMFTPMESIQLHNYTIQQEVDWQDTCWNTTPPCCPGCNATARTLLMLEQLGRLPPCKGAITSASS